MAEDTRDLMGLVADVVSAYVSNNAVRAGELPELIAAVHGSLVLAENGGNTAEPAAEQKPAVPVKKSVTPDAIICLEDGKAFKSLKRHLMTSYGLTPQAYRAKWGLPDSYPMVAPNYAAARSSLAKSMGLGANRRKQQPEFPRAQEPAKRGRPKRISEPV